MRLVTPNVLMATLAVLSLSLLLPRLAAADEPPATYGYRLELGGSVERRWSRLDGEALENHPALRLGLGKRLSARWELAAGVRHMVFTDDDERYKNLRAYTDFTLGARFVQPLGRVRLFAEPSLLWNWFETGYSTTEQRAGSAPGVSARLGVDVAVTGAIWAGVTFVATSALRDEDAATHLLGLDAHVGVHF